MQFKITAAFYLHFTKLYFAWLWKSLFIIENEKETKWQNDKIKVHF